MDNPFLIVCLILVFAAHTYEAHRSEAWAMSVTVFCLLIAGAIFIGGILELLLT